ncbi:hypothetical protein SAMN04487905_106276 [Actinopolyspora xinjiangensis]|uniref:Uncharacterized protein n=1 Tax=Actinopolyspora xinjiangensis TaxID=405564 RepID=A0A1H0UGK7_9ACTN|nr:hypothetical protein SAMN04487905_106276 [Actinopolyspora xinjiangensis]
MFATGSRPGRNQRTSDPRTLPPPTRTPEPPQRRRSEAPQAGPAEIRHSCERKRDSDSAVPTPSGHPRTASPRERGFRTSGPPRPPEKPMMKMFALIASVPDPRGTLTAPTNRTRSIQEVVPSTGTGKTGTGTDAGTTYPPRPTGIPRRGPCRACRHRRTGRGRPRPVSHGLARDRPIRRVTHRISRRGGRRTRTAPRGGSRPPRRAAPGSAAPPRVPPPGSALSPVARARTPRPCPPPRRCAARWP